MENYFYSFVLHGEIQESKFQFLLENYYKTDNGDIKPMSDVKYLKFSNSLLDSYFLNKLWWKIPIYELENFLEFHYQKYIGNKNDFLTYIKYTIDVALKGYEHQVSSIGSTLEKKMLDIPKTRATNCYQWIEKKQIQKPPKEQKKTSYVWQSNPDKELPELYNLMLNKYKLIAPETTYEQFKAVFTGQPIDEGFEPIKWHDDNASELLYFIGKLEQLNNIAHNPKKADYQKMTVCFVKPDGKPFNAAWKSLKTNLGITLSPDKQKPIDELVNNF